MTDEELIKKARNEYYKKYRANNVEKIKAYRRKWYQENRDKQREYTRKCFLKKVEGNLN